LGWSLKRSAAAERADIERDSGLFGSRIVSKRVSSVATRSTLPTKEPGLIRHIVMKPFVRSVRASRERVDYEI
jgi:hypothetical protein